MLRQLTTIAYYTLLEALRNRLMWLMLLIAIAGLALSGFLHQLAITESRQIQVALMAAFLRLAAVFLLASFVVTSMAREQHDKGLEIVLALPLPRAGYALGKLLGFALLAFIPALLFGALTSLFAQWQQALLWTASLILELWIVAAFSLLCVLTFKQIIAALGAVLAFYTLTRSIAALQLISVGPLSEAVPSQQVLGKLIGGLAIALPNLDQFTRSEWLVYHSGNLMVFWPLLVQSAIYLLLLASCAVFDLSRKNI